MLVLLKKYTFVQILKKVQKTRRENIVEEASKLFKQKGFRATSVRELAEKVGMEAASLYNHIASKDDILEEICFRLSHRYISFLDEIDRSDISNLDKMRALIRHHVRLIIEDTEGVSVVNNDWKHLKEPALSRFKNDRKEYEKRLAGIIEKGIATGEFQSFNVSVVLFTILSAVRWVELWYKPNRDISPQVLEDDIVSMLLKGLKK